MPTLTPPLTAEQSAAFYAPKHGVEIETLTLRRQILFNTLATGEGNERAIYRAAAKIDAALSLSAEG